MSSDMLFLKNFGDAVEKFIEQKEIIIQCQMFKQMLEEKIITQEEHDFLLTFAPKDKEEFGKLVETKNKPTQERIAQIIIDTIETAIPDDSDDLICED